MQGSSNCTSEIQIEEVSLNNDRLLEDDDNGLGIGSDDIDIDENDLEIDKNDLDLEGKDLEIESNDFDNDCDGLLELDGNDLEESGGDRVVGVNSLSQGNGYRAPEVGMEFELYDDAYNYYNSYARELGFAIRVKSSWTKRNSKEKRGAVLCCNCEGFKMVKEANSRRKETRTGCLAMIRLRLVESNRWRVDEVKLEHNHSFDPERALNSKSQKKVDASAKRKMEPAIDVEVRTIKLYRAFGDPLGHETLNSSNGEISHNVDHSRRLKLKNGEAKVLHDYFSNVQLSNPNFLYLLDLNEEGCLRNVFWIDSRSRAAYTYFSDVVALDTTCLSQQYELPLLAFVGVNHHGQSILLGCGLLGDQTSETYIWLFRTWLTCMSGRPPQTIITDQCRIIQSAIGEVFPRAHHLLSLSIVMQSILHYMSGRSVQDSESFQMVLSSIVYGSKRVEEFEGSWEDMIMRFRLTDHELLRSLYQDRERWAPVYIKDTSFAETFAFHQVDSATSFFDGYVHQQTSLKEFFDIYESVLRKKYEKEALEDLSSEYSCPVFKTRTSYELQLSKLYTNEIFRRFQDEIVMMSSCYNITQTRTSGCVSTYSIKEHEGEGHMRDIRDFEVTYDKSGVIIRCNCGCFLFNGYLCRHALCILNYNGMQEIPYPYILSRWRKNYKRLYIPDLGSNNIDTTNPIQWFDHLYKRAMQVVQEGMVSQDHHAAALQAFKESLNKVRLVADKAV